MSNQITVATNLNINNNGDIVSSNNSAFYTTTSSLVTYAPQLLPANSIVKLSASLGSYDVIAFTNKDTTSSIAVYSDGSGSNILSVIPPTPRPATVLQGLTSSFYAKAFPSASYIGVIGSPA